MKKKEKDLHVLKKLVGKTCLVECFDWDLLVMDEAVNELTGDLRVRVLDVNSEWIRIEYERRKEGTLFQKENVVRLIDLSMIAGVAVEVAEE